MSKKLWLILAIVACIGLTERGEAGETTAETYAAAHALQIAPALTMVGTIDKDGFPQIRVMSNLRHPDRTAAKLAGDGDFTAYAVTRADSEKMEHLATDPKMSMYYQEGGQGLLLMGTTEVVTDAEARRAVWDEAFKQLGYGSGPDDPMLTVLRFVPSHGKFYSRGRQYPLSFPPLER